MRIARATTASAVAIGFALMVVLVQAAGQPSAARRIVSLVPAITEMLFAVGAGDRVVGVSTFDTYPPEVSNLPRVGALIDPDLERILTLRPSTVIVYESQRDLQIQLGRAGVPYFAYRHVTSRHGALDDIPNTIERIGALADRSDQARTLASRIRDGLASAARAAEGRPRPSTLLVISREPGTLRSVYAVGGVGFLHEMIEAAGGRNVFGDVARENLQATVEQILARRPEVIVEVRVGPDAEIDPERTAREWSRLSTVPAVRSGRVRVVSDPSIVIPGPRVLAAIEQLRALLAP